MSHGIKLVAVILVIITVTSATPTQFPHGNTLVYNYYGDVKAGIIEPASYASQFAIAGQLHIKHDTSDPTLPYAYYVTLTNVKTGMHNGVASHFQRTTIISPIPDAAKIIQEPFLIINNENGELQGVKIPDNEADWSKNMKMAIATMLQLNLMDMKLQLPVKHHNFISKEKTIQGECWTSYDVHAKLPIADVNNKNFVVTKFSSPKNCTDYNVHEFDHVDAEQCNLPREAPVNMASRRIFDIEHQGDNILIKSLIAHGGTNYFPLIGRSEAHYVLNNASFVLDKIVPLSDIQLPVVDFQKIPITNDRRYKRPLNNYAINGAMDVTHGRHVVHQNVLITIIKKMLGEAADYLEEHHLDAKDPDFKHGQTVNRILYNMGYLDTQSLEQIFIDIIVPEPTDRDNVIKNIFIGIIPHVGTAASTILVRDLILSRSVGIYDAFTMLSNLPLNIRNPNEKLLVDMEELIKADDREILIRQSSILCFSTLLYRTYKNVPNPKTNVMLQKYLNNFYDHLISETTYEMKVTYLNAIRNVEIGDIVQLLTPIIRGDIEISDNPVHLRLMAIWTIKKAIENDYNAAHDLLWPIMADYNVELKLRIAAYDILIRQSPTMINILHIYWFMVYEKNEHLYNYHHTTIKGLANSIDPCNYKLREMTTKIMRYTKIHAPVSYGLSSSYMADSMDNIYGHGEKFTLSTTLSETTGIPEVIHFELITIEGRKPVSDVSIDLHIEGLHNILPSLMDNKPIVMGNLNNENVLNLLKKVASDMPPMKKIHTDIVLMRKGRVIFVNHYNEKSLEKLYNDIGQLIESMTNDSKINKQHVTYINIYEQQIISEMGLPVMIGTKSPQVSSIKAEVSSTTVLSEKIASLNVDMRLWRHGDYFMSIYNPLMDVWHSIKRSSALDISIPIRLILNVHNGLIKWTLPLLPIKKDKSILGIKIHTKDITTVTEDENNTLKSACPTCHHHEIVTNGVASKKYYTDTIDHKDTGLQYMSSIFDCENEISPIYMKKQWIRNVLIDYQNSWNDICINTILGARLYLKNIVLSPPMGSCGIIGKIEPSIVYPTSHIDIKYRTFQAESDDSSEIHGLLNHKEINIRGTMEAIAASTNETSRSWDMNINADISHGHLNNSIKIQLTRVTPGEKIFKICIDGQKIYPQIPMDPLKVGITREETNGKLTISMSHIDNDNDDNLSCTRDESVITIVAKGELSNEQKKLFNRDSNIGECKNDIDNPLMKNPNGLIPRTINCIDETMRHTTLKKYTLNITYKKVPQYIISQIIALEDYNRALTLSNIKYTNEHVESGTINIGIEIPEHNDIIDMSIVTPLHSYDLIDVNIDDDIYPPRHNGFGWNYDKYLWTFPLDNTRFAMKFLHSYTSNVRKVCTLFPKIVLTLDNGKIPYLISNEWTLILGNYVQNNLAIFVKNINDKLAIKIYADSIIIEINPHDNGFDVIADDEIYNNINDPIYIPSIAISNYIAKITKYGDQIIVQLLKQSLIIIQTSNSVTMFVDNHLQGLIGGLCGHMTGDYKTKIPKDYHLN